MIIEGILIVKGHSKDLYSPLYYRDVDHLKYKLSTADGMVYLYGYLKQYYGYHDKEVRKVPAVASLASMPPVDTLDLELHENFIELKDEFDTRWNVANPPFPPETGWVSDDITIDMHNLLNRCIANHDQSAPTYFSVNQDVRFTVKKISDREILILDKNHVLHINSCLVFLNGLCVYSEPAFDSEFGTCLKITDVDGVCNNPDDRDRGILVLDFGGSNEIVRTKLSAMTGSLDTDLKTSNVTNLKSRSYLLSIDGRLFLPDEFFIYEGSDGTTIEFDVDKHYSDACILDKKVCQKAFVRGTRNVVIQKPSSSSAWKRELCAELKNSPNSFLIEFATPNLRVVRHFAEQEINKSQLTQTSQASTATVNTVTFKGGSRGIVMDLTTRSIIEQHQQRSNQSFVLEPFSMPVFWDREIVRLAPSTLLKMWLQIDNHMSTYASMYDCRQISGDEQVLWPRYVMLDFIFVS